MSFDSVENTNYSEKYFLNNCGGKEFYEAGIINPVFQYELLKYPVAGHMVTADIGCGKGDFLPVLAGKCSKVYGIDYADAAIELAAKYLKNFNADIKNKIVLLKADAKKIPIADKSVDIVYLNDVFEHLYDWELEQTFSEIRRIIKQNGLLIIHTAPNTYYYKFILYNMQCFVNKYLKKSGFTLKLFKQPKSEWDMNVHVNEQNPFSLKKRLSKIGFKSRIAVLPNFKYYYDWLYKDYSSSFPFKKYSKIKTYLFLRIIFRWPLKLILARSLIAKCKIRK